MDHVNSCQQFINQAANVPYGHAAFLSAPAKTMRMPTTKEWRGRGDLFIPPSSPTFNCAGKEH